MAQKFLGRGLKFPLVLVKGTFAISEGDDKIRESILSILRTALGERVMRPDFGSNIHSQVFAPIDATTIGYLSQNVRESLIQWESRIEVQSVRVNEEKSHQGVMLIEINYRIRSSNTNFNLVYPFYIRGFSD